MKTKKLDRATRPYLIAVVVGLFAAQLSTVAAENRIMRTAIRSSGSVPPGAGQLRCVMDLNGKPYSDASIHACLNSIASVSFVQGVKIRKSVLEDGRILIVFAVSARP